jgi:hypothetical protein
VEPQPTQALVGRRACLRSRALCLQRTDILHGVPTPGQLGTVRRFVLSIGRNIRTAKTVYASPRSR